MWEQEEFAKHWRNEFPDGEVPHMALKSVEDIESELEVCKANLKRLQKELAEEKFKVIYLEATVARQKRSHPENFSKTRQRREDDGDADRSKVPDAGGVKLHTAWAASPFGRERGRFTGGRTGKPVPIPVPPRRFTPQRADPAPVAAVSRPGDADESSDREYDDAELNENFVKNNLLAPKPAWDPRRPYGHGRDLDLGDDGRLSPSFPHIHGSGFSTPERRSDGYLSSDHEDSSSGTRLGGSNTSARAHGSLSRDTVSCVESPVCLY